MQPAVVWRQPSKKENSQFEKKAEALSRETSDSRSALLLLYSIGQMNSLLSMSSTVGVDSTSTAIDAADVVLKSVALPPAAGLVTTTSLPAVAAARRQYTQRSNTATTTQETAPMAIVMRSVMSPFAGSSLAFCACMSAPSTTRVGGEGGGTLGTIVEISVGSSAAARLGMRFTGGGGATVAPAFSGDGGGGGGLGGGGGEFINAERGGVSSGGGEGGEGGEAGGGIGGPTVTVVAEIAEALTPMALASEAGERAEVCAEAAACA